MLNTMKRTIGIILLLGLITVAFGCSGNVGAPVFPEGLTADTPTPGTEGHLILGAFTFTIDPVTHDVMVVPDRVAEVHFNVTPMILPPNCPDCIGIHLLGIQQGTNLHTLEVNLRNPSTLTGYDVRAIMLFDDYDNRRLVNYEARTELFDDGGVFTKNPFVTFRDVADSTNAFGPGAIISRLMIMDFPKPRNYAVNFVIEASFPGNSKDPWTISGEDVDNPLDESGLISTIVSCQVADHQEDVVSVTLDASNLGFTEPIEMENITGKKWQIEITNEYNAPIGYYGCEIEARDATDKWPLYDDVLIVVEEDIDPYIYVDSNYSGIPEGTEEKPFPTINSGMLNSLPGQIVLVKEGTYVENVNLITGAHIRGYGLTNPVVRGLGEALMYAGQFCEGAIIENFTLKGNGTSVLYGIHILDASNVEFHNIEFTSTGSARSFQQAVKAEGATGFTLADGTFQDMKASGGAPILISVNASSNVLFESNYINNFEFSPGSAFPMGTGAVFYLYNSDYVLIKQNLVGIVGGSVGLFDSLSFSGIRMNGGSNVTLSNNLLYDFHPNGDCHLTLAGVSVNGTTDFSIEHMTMDSIGFEDQTKGNLFGIDILYGSADSIVNNLITNVNDTLQGHGYGISSAPAATQTYSDVWMTGADDSYRYDDMASEGAGGMNVNPEYENPSSGDYHLMVSSPCLTTGMGGVQMGAYGGSDPLDLP